VLTRYIAVILNNVYTVYLRVYILVHMTQYSFKFLIVSTLSAEHVILAINKHT